MAAMTLPLSVVRRLRTVGYLFLIAIVGGGVSKARNVGLQKAMGEFVYFVDADDFLAPCHLQQYIDALPGSDIVFQGYNVVEEQTGKVLKKKSVGYMYGDTNESVVNVILNSATL